MQTIDYQQQAQSFLDQFGVKFRATLSDSKIAPWKDDDKIVSGSGHHYRVTLSKSGYYKYPPNKGWFNCPSRLTFDFWGSVHDAKAGIKTVTPYDVLACISVDARACDEFTGFKEWCDNYGYEQDSIKALQTFRRCSAFAKRLQAFFTKDELAELQTIQ